MKDTWKDKPRVKRMEEEMLSSKTSQGVRFTKDATFGEGDGLDEEGHGQDEGKHEKGKSRK